jgi:hypothetical protein
LDRDEVCCHWSGAIDVFVVEKVGVYWRIADFINCYYGALVVTTVVAGGAFTSVTVAMNHINNKIVIFFFTLL